MTDSTKYLTSIFLLMALLAGSYYVGYISGKETIIKTDIKQIHTQTNDTTIIERTPIKVIQKEGDIVYIKDTIIQTQPFIVKLDTIIQHDTINVDYTFPQNKFNMLLRQHPDSIITKTVTITDFRIVEIKRPVYIDILSHSGAFIIGGLIGYGVGK